MERFVLLEGHTCQSIQKDYGYDLVITTFGHKGEQENGNIYVQLKATDNLRLHKNEETIAHSISRKDVNSWRDEIMPVIFIVYDAKNDQAYWLYLQDYFENSPLFKMPRNESMTVYLSKQNVVNRQAIVLFKEFKERVLHQLSGVVKHRA